MQAQFRFVRSVRIEENDRGNYIKFYFYLRIASILLVKIENENKLSNSVYRISC